MKRKIALSLATVMALSSLPLNAYANTKSSVDRVLTVRQDTVLADMSDMPYLTITSSDDHTQDFDFELKLTNAEWVTNDSGSFEPGISFQRIGNTSLIIHVNVPDGQGDDEPTFDAANENMKIPLEVKVTKDGEAIVNIDGLNSTVSSASHMFAKVPYDGDVTFTLQGSVETIVDTATINDVVFNDSTAKVLKAGEKIKLKLSNNLKFTDNVTVLGTGKFADNIDLVINESDRTEANIVMRDDTSATTGKIVISNFEITPGNSTSYGNVELKVTYDGNSSSMTVAQYKKLVSADTDIVINDVDAKNVKPEISGTGAVGLTVLVKIDGKEIGTAKIDASGKWTVPYKEILDPLTEGTHNVTVSYYRESTKKETKTNMKSFTTDLSSNDVIFTIGLNQYVNGEEKANLDAAPYIENGRTMLPLRAMANVLGITDENIQWNEEEQLVRLTAQDGTVVEITIGSSDILVNGVRKSGDGAAAIKEGRTFLPLRSVLNAFNLTNDAIIWNEADKTVTIKK